MKKVILITGASSGIGFATLEKLVNEGHVVYGTVRKKEDAATIQKAGGHPLLAEMTDYASLEKAYSKLLKEQRRIDVLFNNAGYGLFGAVEDISIDEAKHQFDVNLFGLAYLTKVVLPQMRKQKSGLIINTSSIGGKMYTPMGAWYHATKHALEGWSDSLRLEVAEFGINVVILEPGVIKTPWGALSADNLERTSGSGSYKKLAKVSADRIRMNYEKSDRLASPSVVANVVSKAIKAKRPKTRYAVGSFARLAITMRKYLSDRTFDRIITRIGQ